MTSYHLKCIFPKSWNEHFFFENFGFGAPRGSAVAELNETPSLHDYCWNVRDPRGVLLPEMVPGCCPKTILVHSPTLELHLGSLGGPKIGQNSMKLTKVAKLSAQNSHEPLSA